MRTVQMEYLRPGEIIAERARFSVVYLPVAPLEWHGAAMPLGTDPLMAQAWARAAAKTIGGVVMPTLFFGTERERPAYILEAKGFVDAESLYIKGMDVPNNAMKSFYAREDIFALTVREHLRLLVEQGYKLIVIVNGHGAWGQTGTLERLAKEFTGETDSRVLFVTPVVQLDDVEQDWGHGCTVECSVIRSLHDDCVDLSAYPPRDVKLPYVDYGIADDFVFTGKRSPDNCVVYDPRDATPELGRKVFDAGTEMLCEKVREAYADVLSGVQK